MRKILALLLCLCLTVTPAKARAGQKYVALTFDDGPSGRFTRQLLDGLYERGAKATFFLCGYRVAQYPDITQRILEEGHEVGLHGYSHQDMRQMSRRDIASELEQTRNLLPPESAPIFFRPPGGCCADNVRQVAQARGLAILGWSVDPRDWATDNTAAIEKAVLEHVDDGDIVLLHDMSTSSVKAALDIVQILQEQDFELVTVSELVRLRGAKVFPGKTYSAFAP